MIHLENATAADVAVAFLVLVNTALLAWGNWQRTRQNARLAEKVDAVARDADIHRNGHISDDAG